MIFKSQTLDEINKAIPKEAEMGIDYVQLRNRTPQQYLESQIPPNSQRVIYSDGHNHLGKNRFIVWFVRGAEIGLLLAWQSGNELGYQHMWEAQFPYYHSCPLEFLELCPATCDSWREGVRNFWKEDDPNVRQLLIDHELESLRD